MHALQGDSRPVTHEAMKRRADRLLAAGYWRQYGEMVRRMNVTVWWSGIVDGELQILNNGTMCYLDTGVAKLGVTADHVYAEYLEQKAAIEGVQLQLGENTINLEQHLIDRDSYFDLATFRIPEVFVGAGTSYYHENRQWPPKPLQRRDVVVHGGFPQVLRERGKGAVDFGFQFFVSAVSDVTGDKVVLYPPEDAYWPDYPDRPLNQDFGGKSGGPVYRVVDANIDGGGNEPIDRVELAGFIYNKVLGSVLARPASMVAADGTLRRSA